VRTVAAPTRRTYYHFKQRPPSARAVCDAELKEAITGLYKTELIKPRSSWHTLADVELATTEWIEWYDNRRLHGEIGHVPPVEYETAFYNANPNEQLAGQP
jgi:transposase InsO family protein